MRILKFYKRIMKIIKIQEIAFENKEKNKNPRIRCENHENHENLRIQFDNNENHEIT